MRGGGGGSEGARERGRERERASKRERVSALLDQCTYSVFLPDTLTRDLLESKVKMYSYFTSKGK